MADPIEPRRLHPVSPVVDLTVWLPRFWPVALVAWSRSWGAVAIAVVVVAVLATRTVAWWRTTYAFDGDELTVWRGVWQRSVRRVPVARLQQVEVTRKLRHQALGVAMVRIQLADGGTDDGDVVLEVLAVADAERLKSALEQTRRAADVGADTADAVPPPPAHEVLRLPTGLLALGGVTGASLLFLPAAIAAMLSGLDDVGLDDDVEDVASRLTIAWSVAGALVVSVLAAAVFTVVRNHGLRVTRRATDLVVERGLFERRATTVPLARVQLVRLHRNVVRRRLGLASVDVMTSGRATGEGSGSADDSVPVARWNDALAVAAVAMGDRAVGGADRPAVAAAVARLVRRRVLQAVAGTAWVPVVFGPRWIVVPLVVVAVVAAVARASASARRHGVGDDVVVVEDGVLGWSRHLVPVDRVQSWRVVQGPLQRRHGLMDVVIDLSGRRTVRVVDASAAQAAAVVDTIGRFPAVETDR